MSSVEGKKRIGDKIVAVRATDYGAVTTTTAAWTEIPFLDLDGDPFVSRHIRFRCLSNPMDFSFDPRPQKDVHGSLIADEVFHMWNKEATSVFVKRTGAGNGTMQVTAWR